jgi:hypothetical protein
MLGEGVGGNAIAFPSLFLNLKIREATLSTNERLRTREREIFILFVHSVPSVFLKEMKKKGNNSLLYMSP